MELILAGFIISFFIITAFLSFRYGFTYGIFLSFILTWFVFLPTGENLPIYNLSFFELLLIFFLFRFFSKTPNKSKYTRRIINLHFLLFVIGLISFLILSDDVRFGFLFLRNGLLIPFLIILASLNFLDTQKKIETAFSYFKYSVLFFLIFLLINFFFDGYIGSTDYNLNRLGGVATIPFGNWGYNGSVQLGSLLVIVLSLFLPSILYGKTKISFNVLFLILLTLTIFLTGSRGSIITLIIIFTVYYFLMSNFSVRKLPVNKLYRFILLIISFAFIFQNIRQEFRQAERIDSIYNLDEDASFLYRISQLELGFEVLFERPMGIGFGRENRVTNNEHNIYFFIGYGTGIVGLFIYLYILFIINKQLKISLAYQKSDILPEIITGGKLAILALLINGLSDAILMDGFQSVGVYICLGISIASSNYLILSAKKNEKP